MPEQSDETCTSDQDVVVPCVKDAGDLTRNGVIWRLVIFAILLAFAIKPIWWSPGGDAVIYLDVAQSLWQTGQLEAFGSKAIFNQVGVAFFFAPAFAFADRPFLMLSVMQWAAAVGIMILCYRWLRKELNRDHSMLMTWLILLNTSFWIYYLRFLSETWCCVLLFTLALMYQELVNAIKQGRYRSAWLWCIASLPVMVWAALTRNICTFMVGGLAVVLLRLYWQQRMGRILLHGMAMVLLVSLVGGVTAGGWLLYQQKQTDATSQVSESYLEFAERALSENAQQSRSVVKVVTDSIHRRTTTLGRAVVPGMFRTYPEDGQWLHPLTFVNVIVTILAICGFLRLARSSLDVYVWMTPFYVVLLLVLPYGAGTRLLLPVMPVVWLSLYELFKERSWQKNAIMVLLVLHLIITVGRVVSMYPHELQRHQEWPIIDTLAQSVDQIDPQRQATWAYLGMDSDYVSMLSFSRNRLIVPFNPESQAQYIVVVGDTQRPQNYQWIQSVENYHLLELKTQ
ncbi:MAG TPA: hypothetical protein DER01_02425 [Phycisphaerales bacterium]|nr:hypothetical protein [Phycisphaerales bacterium]